MFHNSTSLFRQITLNDEIRTIKNKLNNLTILKIENGNIIGLHDLNKEIYNICLLGNNKEDFEVLIKNVIAKKRNIGLCLYLFRKDIYLTFITDVLFSILMEWIKEPIKYEINSLLFRKSLTCLLCKDKAIELANYDIFNINRIRFNHTTGKIKYHFDDHVPDYYFPQIKIDNL